MKMPPVVQQWLLSRDTGVSSMAIVAHLTDTPMADRWHDHPHDPHDFGRCYRLLQLYPPFALSIGKMATRSPQWAALVEIWDELSALYREVEPKPGRWNLDASKRMYARMREVLAPTEGVRA